MYDSAFGVYPVCVKNAVGQAEIVRYYGVPGPAVSDVGTGVYQCPRSPGAGDTAWAANGNPLTGRAFGQAQETQDANRASTGYTYDQWGRPTAVTRPDDTSANPTEAYVYYDALRPFRLDTKVREVSGCAGCSQPTVTFYDGFGRVIQTKVESQNDSEMIVTDTRYNALGQVQDQYVPYKLNNSTTFYDFVALNTAQPKTTTTYDALGRVTKVTAPDGTASETLYRVEVNPADPDFNTPRPAVYSIDANRHFVRRASDVFGNLRSVSESTGSWPVGQAYPTWGSDYRTRYTYDVAGRLLTVQDHAYNQTTLTYDTLGRKRTMSDPDMGAWSYAYDAAGNLVRQTDTKNQRICFYYDALNRLKGKTYSTGAADCPPDPGYAGYTVKNYYDDTTYTYSEGSTTVTNKGLGRRTQMVDVSGSTQWVYDGRGRLRKETKSVTGAGSFMTQWDYDAADRLTVQKYPGGNAGQAGEQVNFAYAPSTWLQSVSGAAIYVGDTTYNALGQVTERRLGSATGVLRQLYDYTAAENFRLVSLKAGTAAPYTNRQNLSYTYDDVGNVLTISDAAAYGGSQTQTFTYDPLDRLSTAQASGTPPNYGAYSQKSYAYDAIGNLTTFEGTALYYQDATHKHAVTHVGGTTAGYQKYWYDQNGNATKRINASQTITLTYDAENRLTGMAGGVTSSYVYDGDGARVKETSGGTTTVYVGAYFEWTGSTATMKSYYYAGGTRVAMRTGTASAGTINYLLGDHLGSTSLTLDSAGNRLNTNTELRYYPYGVPRYTAGTTPTTFNFTGQRKDSGTGLLFYNARWYDPVVGRFLQADTIVPGAGDPQR